MKQFKPGKRARLASPGPSARPGGCAGKGRGRTKLTTEEDAVPTQIDWDEDLSFDTVEPGQHYLICMDADVESHPTAVIKVVGKPPPGSLLAWLSPQQRDEYLSRLPLKYEWLLRWQDTSLGLTHRRKDRSDEAFPGDTRQFVCQLPEGVTVPENELWLCADPWDPAYTKVTTAHLIRKVQVRWLSPRDPVPPVARDVFFYRQSYSENFKRFQFVEPQQAARQPPQTAAANNRPATPSPLGRPPAAANPAGRGQEGPVAAAAAAAATAKDAVAAAASPRAAPTAPRTPDCGPDARFPVATHAPDGHIAEATRLTPPSLHAEQSSRRTPSAGPKVTPQQCLPKCVAPRDPSARNASPAAVLTAAAAAAEALPVPPELRYPPPPSPSPSPLRARRQSDSDSDYGTSSCRSDAPDRVTRRTGECCLVTHRSARGAAPPGAGWAACATAIGPRGDAPACQNHRPGAMGGRGGQPAKVLHLCCGCGGLAMYGTFRGRELVNRWAVDLNLHACTSFLVNHRGSEVCCARLDDWLGLVSRYNMLCDLMGLPEGTAWTSKPLAAPSGPAGSATPPREAPMAPAAARAAAAGSTCDESPSGGPRDGASASKPVHHVAMAGPSGATDAHGRARGAGSANGLPGAGTGAGIAGCAGAGLGSGSASGVRPAILDICGLRLAHRCKLDAERLQLAEAMTPDNSWLEVYVAGDTSSPEWADLVRQWAHEEDESEAEEDEEEEGEEEVEGDVDEDEDNERRSAYLWIPVELLLRGAHGHPAHRQLLRDFLVVLMEEDRLPRRGDVFMVVAGTPCQNVSSNNLHAPKQGVMRDPKNRLVLPVLDVAELLRPPYILLEQVPGAVSREGAMWCRAATGRLLAAGYATQLVDVAAGAQGACEDRHRLFLCGAAFGWPLPAPPCPTHSHEPTIKLVALESCRPAAATGGGGGRFNPERRPGSDASGTAAPGLLPPQCCGDAISDLQPASNLKLSTLGRTGMRMVSSSQLASCGNTEDGGTGRGWLQSVLAAKVVPLRTTPRKVRVALAYCLAAADAAKVGRCAVQVYDAARRRALESGVSGDGRSDHDPWVDDTVEGEEGDDGGSDSWMVGPDGDDDDDGTQQKAFEGEAEGDSEGEWSDEGETEEETEMAWELDGESESEVVSEPIELSDSDESSQDGLQSARAQEQGEEEGKAGAGGRKEGDGRWKRQHRQAAQSPRTPSPTHLATAPRPQRSKTPSPAGQRAPHGGCNSGQAPATPQPEMGTGVGANVLPSPPLASEQEAHAFALVCLGRKMQEEPLCRRRLGSAAKAWIQAGSSPKSRDRRRRQWRALLDSERTKYAEEMLSEVLATREEFLRLAPRFRAILQAELQLAADSSAPSAQVPASNPIRHTLAPAPAQGKAGLHREPLPQPQPGVQLHLQPQPLPQTEKRRAATDGGAPPPPPGGAAAAAAASKRGHHAAHTRGAFDPGQGPQSEPASSLPGHGRVQAKVPPKRIEVEDQSQGLGPDGRTEPPRVANHVPMRLSITNWERVRCIRPAVKRSTRLVDEPVVRERAAMLPCGEPLLPPGWSLPGGQPHRRTTAVAGSRKRTATGSAQNGRGRGHARQAARARASQLDAVDDEDEDEDYCPNTATEDAEDQNKAARIEDDDEDTHQDEEPGAGGLRDRRKPSRGRGSQQRDQWNRRGFTRLGLRRRPGVIDTSYNVHTRPVCHPRQHRLLTLREGMRMHGFPDHYVICVAPRRLPIAAALHDEFWGLLSYGLVVEMALEGLRAAEELWSTARGGDHGPPPSRPVGPSEGKEEQGARLGAAGGEAEAERQRDGGSARSRYKNSSRREANGANSSQSISNTDEEALGSLHAALLQAAWLADVRDSGGSTCGAVAFNAARRAEDGNRRAEQRQLGESVSPLVAAAWSVAVRRAAGWAARGAAGQAEALQALGRVRSVAQERKNRERAAGPGRARVTTVRRAPRPQPAWSGDTGGGRRKRRRQGAGGAGQAGGRGGDSSQSEGDMSGYSSTSTSRDGGSNRNSDSSS